MAVEFELDGQKFVALNGGPKFKFNEAISFQVYCDDQEEIDDYWEKLSAGGDRRRAVRLAEGQVRRVLADRPDGLIEKISDPDPEKARRDTEAMLSMTKFDFAALERAYAGE